MSLFLCQTEEILLSEALLDSLTDDPHAPILVAYVDSLPVAALARIVDAERWCSGALWEDGRRDLCGHAADVVPTHRWGERVYYAQDVTVKLSFSAGTAWDQLVSAHGLARCVGWVQELAADRIALEFAPRAAA